jgi:hypothetical protein
MKHKDPREIEYASVAHHPKSANRPTNTGVVLFLSERFPPVAAAKTELLINMAFRFGDPCETANLLLIYESEEAAVLVAPVVAPIWKHTGKTKQETFK